MTPVRYGTGQYALIYLQLKQRQEKDFKISIKMENIGK